MRLDEKTALVTGGGRGIGRAVSSLLAQRGAHVYVNYVNRPEAAQQTVADIVAGGGKATAIQFDIADFSATQAAIARLLGEIKVIDILVNNAGITRDGLLARMKEDDWDAVMSTNVKGAFACTKAVVKPMMKQRSGRIVTIGSVVGATGNGGQVNYAAAKAALVGMTKTLARELSSRAITVNCVAPGYIETEMTQKLSDSVRAELLSQIPLAKLGGGADVAAAVAFLASDEASYITGQTIHVNGGMFMG
ncbi:MAG: 3-oxoacyl-[acyl-carrier-protein] reductase [Desulfofustis sp. PB-SRB1]|jgi:3-oxoacyl-[acyl-carrier protein] reductase|nr:3-oxoacyl-[acyl-carrier-protein] reductase [Desulfofustis sp. PB-SRB1]MBM1003774.1 3-oxoacyl-[acyl-carrier-protein] reductase [Desulfofustis sp. PB-SRB1]HBH29141.1 3-oxoacyl-[acyl-carrier-protein] reductase [Desulfofustis sp.]HBH32675.1 3-oxoacyl-[acyl-carrier-protein] reductase [Desulfofustis sp.]